MIEPDSKMRYYRITKYNPNFRNADGSYSKEEWTSVCDIGKAFQGEVLTEEEYRKTEKAYIQVVISLADLCQIKHFLLSNFEAGKVTKWKNGIISLIEATEFMQNCLREECWGKLSETNMEIHFGYDYYMYVGTNVSKRTLMTIARDNGLYCEPFKSPYT